MKKIIGIALVLAVVSSLCFGGVALAADPPEVVVTFNVTDPDITVTAFKPNDMSNDWAWEGTAQFTLTGTGSAFGTINAGNTGVFECYTDITGQPQVYGGYTASDGDFKSTFSAYSYETDSGYYEMAAWSEHSIDAIGVTNGSMAVNGGATAFWGGGSSNGGFVEGWQTYNGEAEVVEVFGSKMHSNRQPVGGPWYPERLTGAEFTATVTGTSDATFSGGTEAGTYKPVGSLGPYQTLAKQGLGFDIQASSTSTIDADVNTTYSYTVIAIFVDRVVGETASWSGLPGYAPDP